MLDFFVLVAVPTGMMFAQVYQIAGTNRSVNLSLGDLALALAALLLLVFWRRRITIPGYSTWWLVACGLWAAACLASFLTALIGGYFQLAAGAFALVKIVVLCSYGVFPVVWAKARGLDADAAVRTILSVWLSVSSLAVALWFMPFARMWVTASDRFAGFYDDPNLMGACAAQAALVALWVAAGHRGLSRLAIEACGVLLIVGVFLTESRSSLIGLAVGLAVTGMANSRARGTVLRLAGLAFIAGVLDYSYLADLLGRMSWTSFGQALQYRMVLWGAGLDAIQQAPVIGVGRDHFIAWAANHGIVTGYIPHNTYLTAWAETGTLGELAYLAAYIVAPLLIAAKLVRKGQPLALGVVLALVPIWVAGFGVDLENCRSAWLLLGVMFLSASSSPGSRSDATDRRKRMLAEKRRMPIASQSTA